MMNIPLCNNCLEVEPFEECNNCSYNVSVLNCVYKAVSTVRDHCSCVQLKSNVLNMIAILMNDLILNV